MNVSRRFRGTDGTILRALGVAIERDEHNTAQLVPVSICAWCDPDKIQTHAALALGKRVSHTCCPMHTRLQLARARELNRREAA